MEQTKNQILCILFSDLKGYSGIRDDKQKNRIVQHLDEITNQFLHKDAQLIKTAGDGLMICSFTPLPLAESALRLRDAFRNTDWKMLGFPDDFRIRIGIHMDEVTVYYHPDGSVKDAIGVGVDTAARIEPIAEENSVYCSARFYDFLKERGLGKIKGISLGKRSLAKQYGELEIYELLWQQEIKESRQSAQTPTIPMPKINRGFTDKDKKDFLIASFEQIQQYFTEAAKQVGINPGIEGTVNAIDKTKFTCEIYINGQLKTQCKIWYENMTHQSWQILYSEARNNWGSDSSYNESISVADNGRELCLDPNLWMSYMFKPQGATKPSSPDEVAEYLWRRVIQPIQSK